MAAKDCSLQHCSTVGDFDISQPHELCYATFSKKLQYSIVQFVYVHIGNALRSQGADFPLAQTSLRLQTGNPLALLTNAAGYLKYCRWTHITKTVLIGSAPGQSNSLNGSALKLSITHNKVSLARNSPLQIRLINHSFGLGCFPLLVTKKEKD